MVDGPTLLLKPLPAAVFQRLQTDLPGVLPFVGIPSECMLEIHVVTCENGTGGRRLADVSSYMGAYLR